MEKSEQYRDMKMARRFQPPVLSLPWGSNVSSVSRDSQVRGPGPLCLLGVVETGEVAAPGGGSLLPGLAPSGQGHVRTHTHPGRPGASQAPTPLHGMDSALHGRPARLHRWWGLAVAPADAADPSPRPRQTHLCFLLLPGGGEALPPPVRAMCPVRPDVRRRRGDVPAR